MRWARFILRWLFSIRFRKALGHHRHIRHLFNYQHDLLSPHARLELNGVLQDLRRDLHSNAGLDRLEASVRQARRAAERWLTDTWKHRHREVFDLLLVAFATILSIRTFVVQPMTVPTGSMQPTVMGITWEDLRERPEVEFPTGFRRFIDRWVFGRRYLEVVARAPGRLLHAEHRPILPFLAAFPSLYQLRLQLGNQWYTIWSPPTDLPNPENLRPDALLLELAGVKKDHTYRAGETVIRLLVNSGDHILVDRLSYNFRWPKRGELVVFRSTGIDKPAEITHYIKRLVGLGGESLRIGNDRHVRVDGVRLDGSTPRFEQVYSFSGPPRVNAYSGHVNDFVAQTLRRRPGWLAPRFPNEQTVFEVPPGQFFVLGDNTLASEDGRRWGGFPRENVAGRGWMVYWPIGERFGWGRD